MWVDMSRSKKNAYKSFSEASLTEFTSVRPE